MTDNSMFPNVKTPEQAARVERALNEYENAKSKAFNEMARFFDEYAFELKRQAEEIKHEELVEDFTDILRAIETARDAQEAFMRALVGKER